MDIRESPVIQAFLDILASAELKGNLATLVYRALVEPGGIAVIRELKVYLGIRDTLVYRVIVELVDTQALMELAVTQESKVFQAIVGGQDLQDSPV